MHPRCWAGSPQLPESVGPTSPAQPCPAVTCAVSPTPWRSCAVSQGVTISHPALGKSYAATRDPLSLSPFTGTPVSATSSLVNATAGSCHSPTSQPGHQCPAQGPSNPTASWSPCEVLLGATGAYPASLATLLALEVARVEGGGGWQVGPWAQSAEHADSAIAVPGHPGGQCRSEARPAGGWRGRGWFCNARVGFR